MRLVEHLHVAEILREAEENRQRGLASGPEAAAPLSGANADLNLGDSGSFSTACAAVDVQTPAGMERTPGSRAHKGIGMSSFPRASLCSLDFVTTLRDLLVFAPPSFSKKACTSPTSRT